MLEKLDADIEVESAKLALAKEEFERTSQATTQRALSEIDLIRARQQHAAQQATLAAVQAQKQVVAAELAQREAELTAAKENLRLRINDAKTLATAKAAVQLAQAARTKRRCGCRAWKSNPPSPASSCSGTSRRGRR
jgi:hypothetical protein